MIVNIRMRGELDRKSVLLLIEKIQEIIKSVIKNSIGVNPKYNDNYMLLEGSTDKGADCSEDSIFIKIHETQELLLKKSTKEETNET